MEYSGPNKNVMESEQRILFLGKESTQPQDHRTALNAFFSVNKTLIAARVPTHIRILKLLYTKKGNLSGLMTPTGTSSILLPRNRELVLNVA